ncbi:hypothetical protein LJR039_005030 [Pseudorhodoferax sp. LjRoot39]|uniref:hypothetical protein n=1 Tax=Pseudorhodoferax sp. LjRoot39 TaxID=3342328 RepID=UPI003ECDAA13
MKETEGTAPAGGMRTDAARDALLARIRHLFRHAERAQQTNPLQPLVARHQLGKSP